MKKAATEYTLKSLSRTLSMNVSASKDGKYWYPARPLNYASVVHRLRLAWAVFTGQVDVIRWPEDCDTLDEIVKVAGG